MPFEKIHKGLIAERDNLKQRLKEKKKIIIDQEQRLKEERQQFEMRKKSEMAGMTIFMQINKYYCILLELHDIALSMHLLWLI